MQKSLRLIALIVVLLAGNCEIRSEIAASAPEAEAKELRAILENGTQLEIARQWTDAKSLYEQSMRIYAANGKLQSKFSHAKIMCDIQERFSNSNYIPQVQTLDPVPLRSVVGQILQLQIDNFAYPMTLQEIYRRELCGLSVALTSETFQEYVIPQATSESIHAFQEKLLAESRTRQIVDFADLVDATCGLGVRASREFGAKGSFFTMEAVCGLISALDQYSVVLLQPQYQGILSSLKGNFVGIGVEIVQAKEGVRIERVVPNSPACLAGARRGDRFISVNGVSTEDFPLEKVSGLLRGKVGSEVRLELQYGTEPARVLIVKRSDIVTSSIEEIALLEGTDHVGYIRLRSFQNQTAAELEQAIQKLDAAGMEKLVIDLRDNPGGAMRAALDSIALFVPEGQIIMYTKDVRDLTPHRARARKSWDMPLEILVNAGSASASEIFAGCLQDMGRCEVLGTRSYGKGVIQRMFPVENSPFTVKLTTSVFCAPSGKSCHHVGVVPDYSVVQTNHPHFAREGISDTEFDEPELPVLREAEVNARVGGSIRARVNDSDLVLSRAVEYFEGGAERE